MASDRRGQLFVAATIPPELTERLSTNYELVRELPADEAALRELRVAVTTSMAGADERLMASLPSLRLIACNGTGLEKIDLEAARRRGITVRHTPDVVTEDTADFALALLYATVRRVAEADRFVRSGRWASERMTPSRRVHSMTAGIVGLGKIGAAFARRAAGIGMTVLYTGPREKVGVPYRYVADVAALAEAADVLVLTCPGGPATHHLVDAEVLRALGASGYLVNVSRGSVVDEAALIAALAEGRIAGAGLDVFENEPRPDARLRTFDSVVLAPHYAAVTRETRLAMADMLEAAIDALFYEGAGPARA
jgi:lactate dehydrogenase-like 2-hydroxyacid dehydrogenase